MPKEKTICEIEFEKWCDNYGFILSFCKKEDFREAWNVAWKTCGDKLTEAIQQLPGDVK